MEEGGGSGDDSMGVVGRVCVVVDLVHTGFRAMLHGSVMR